MSDVSGIVAKHRGERGELIAILEEIQSRYSYLPETALRDVAEQTGRSLVDIYGVATFYRWFSLKPRGKHVLTCCMGTACHVRGAPRVADELRRQLGVAPGETTRDGEFTFETQNCLGGCALGPIVVADGHYFANVGTARIKEIIDKTSAGLDRIDVRTDQRLFPLEVSCGRCGHGLMDPGHLLDGHPSIRVTVAFEGARGWALLSSLYGSPTVESEHAVPPETVTSFLCPHCKEGLAGGGICAECDAPMVPFVVRGGAVLQLCSRRGCKGHMLDLAGEA